MAIEGNLDPRVIHLKVILKDKAIFNPMKKMIIQEIYSEYDCSLLTKAYFKLNLESEFNFCFDKYVVTPSCVALADALQQDVEELSELASNPDPVNIDQFIKDLPPIYQWIPVEAINNKIHDISVEILQTYPITLLNLDHYNKVYKWLKHQGASRKEREIFKKYFYETLGKITALITLYERAGALKKVEEALVCQCISAMGLEEDDPFANAYFKYHYGHDFNAFYHNEVLGAIGKLLEEYVDEPFHRIRNYLLSDQAIEKFSALPEIIEKIIDKKMTTDYLRSRLNLSSDLDTDPQALAAMMKETTINQKNEV